MRCVQVTMRCFQGVSRSVMRFCQVSHEVCPGGHGMCPTDSAAALAARQLKSSQSRSSYSQASPAAAERRSQSYGVVACPVQIPQVSSADSSGAPHHSLLHYALASPLSPLLQRVSPCRALRPGQTVSRAVRPRSRDPCSVAQLPCVMEWQLHWCNTERQPVPAQPQLYRVPSVPRSGGYTV